MAEKIISNPLIARLRKGDWDVAMVFIKGMANPVQFSSKGSDSRNWIFDGEWLIISGNRVGNPWKQPTPAASGEEQKMFMSDLEVITHIDEISLVQFFRHDSEISLVKG